MKYKENKKQLTESSSSSSSFNVLRHLCAFLTSKLFWFKLVFLNIIGVKVKINTYFISIFALWTYSSWRAWHFSRALAEILLLYEI